MSTPNPRSMIWARFGLFVAIAGGLTLATTLWGLPDAARLREATTHLGPWAPLLSLVVFVAMTLGPVPKNLLSTTAGLLFGMKVGLAIAIIGGLISAVVAFGLGRVLARDLAQRLGGRRLARIDTLAVRHGLAAVVIARLSPIVPFALFNYAAGVAAIGIRPFLIGTTVGILPGSVAYVALGTYGHAPGDWSTAAILLALGIALFFVLSGRLVRLRLERRPQVGSQVRGPHLPSAAT